MPANVPCDECRAIMEEMRLALAGDLSSSERSAEVQANLEAFRQMLQGSERAEEELFDKLRFRAKSPELLASALFTPRMREALRRLAEHAIRTGHRGLFPRR